MSKKLKINTHLVLSDYLDDRFDHKLRSTTQIKNLPEPLKENLKALYAEKKNLNANLLACLLNGLYTEKLDKFLFSVRELQALIQADHKNKNLKTRNSLNDVEFKTFKRYLSDKDIIAIDDDSTPFEAGKKGGKAAICRLIEPRMIKLIDSDSSKKTTNHRVKEDDDEMSLEQNIYEENLQIPELDPELSKTIRDGVKKRNASKKR